MTMITWLLTWQEEIVNAAVFLQTVLLFIMMICLFRVRSAQKKSEKVSRLMAEYLKDRKDNPAVPVVRAPVHEEVKRRERADEEECQLIANVLSEIFP